MKNVALTAGAGLLAFTLATPAISADLGLPYYKAPASVANFNWSGFYVGFNGGYGWGNASFSDPVIGSFADQGTGWLASGTVGYNLQTGSLVWGIEGDFGFSSIKGIDTSVCGASPGCQLENNWLGMARGRVGYAFQQLLVFGTGGAAFGDMKFTNPLGGSEDHSKIGWTLGAGLEYAIIGALSIKAEYLYADLGSVTCSPATCGPSSTINMPINITRMGVNYHF